MAEVLQVPEQSRFVVKVDGQEAGFLSYEAAGEQTWTLVSTEVDPTYRGQGLAGQLVADAVRVARTEGIRLRPLCPYTVSWFERHPQDQDVLDPSWAPPTDN